jgi:putative ATP-dependent endonuclease of the OLD family
MKNNKTECALAIFSSETKIDYPKYILDAIAK